MLHAHLFLPAPVLTAPQSAVPLSALPAQAHSRLRHYIVGSPAATQHAIDRLHLLGYLERLHWSHPISIPDAGLIVRPDRGDVLRYCQRDRRG